MRIFFERTSDGASVWISGSDSSRRLSVPVPVDCSYLSGAHDAAGGPVDLLHEPAGNPAVPPDGWGV